MIATIRNTRHIWIIGLALTLALILAPILVFSPRAARAADDPWAHVPERQPHTDHTYLMEGPYESGQQVTQACLDCHAEAASQVMGTVHWTWEGDPVLLPGREEEVTIGKKNQINNFCIGIQGNWPKCTSCHAGYGWEDENFDFAVQENVDCLVCHDQSGAYVKGDSGNPVEGVDLLAAAQSVGSPTRQNCGTCHFNGGGGNGVKHGDLDESMNFPTGSVDVHMGTHDMQCIDCHWTEAHEISGRSISVSVESENQVLCTNCHTSNLHADERLNAHVDSLACETCHIPSGAVKDPTKMEWDWSAAGEDRGDNPHEYLKIKGSFVYESNFTPEYYWFNGYADRYILGDTIDPTQVTNINLPLGSIHDPRAKIYPFKVHIASQIYDTVYNTLIQPKTAGEGGYWTEFDWDLAARLGSQYTGLPYSGLYGFTETQMFWTLGHMVQPASAALQCSACHGVEGRMDWIALGYPGDPIYWGGRFDD